VAAVWMTVAAPTFLAELMLDSALAAGLYRRLDAVDEGHWLRTAIKRTGWLFVCVMLGFALVGALMQTYAPTPPPLVKSSVTTSSTSRKTRSNSRLRSAPRVR